MAVLAWSVDRGAVGAASAWRRGALRRPWRGEQAWCGERAGRRVASAGRAWRQRLIAVWWRRT
ncbi:hypothetical protein ABZS66_59790 [Dactylosporangium sp. NPDC005572]|uniref:hypothetical protein n=1 Tax=Dactylosporangium sp. NPDC005572 TaxID=3156889 RepID=UPI0033A111C1